MGDTHTQIEDEFFHPRNAHFRSNALGATATTTTRLATIKVNATNETSMMLPLEAGNLPRMT